MDNSIYVPASNAAGMIFSLLIGLGLPVALCIWFLKKKGARLSSFFIGCITLYVSAMILEQLLHQAVLTAAGTALTGNIWLYGLYGGLAAAVFEETGRFVAMKYAMKKQSDRNNALMYGAGHGGMEAFLLLGVTSINNLMLSYSINSGQLDKTLSGMAGDQKAAFIQNISGLWTLPASRFFMGGLERIIAIILQIALSVIIYQAVKTKKKQYFLLAFLIHFLTDFATVAASGFLPVAAVELIALAFTVISVILAYRLCQTDSNSTGAAPVSQR